jgi:hypothetical protein
LWISACPMLVRTRITLSLPEVTRITATSERGTPSNLARKRSSSALAWSSSGKAEPSIEARFAPGETL